MFRIQLNAMWSKDYLHSLAQVLSGCMPCDPEEAVQHVRELAGGRRLAVDVPTVGQAHSLACEFLQYGCYIEIEQVGPLSDAAMIADLDGWFEEGLEEFRVVTSPEGHVTRILEENGYAFLKLETQGVADYVGQQLLRNGAQEVSELDWAALNQRLKQAIAENEVRRTEIRAQRAEAKRSESPPPPKAGEEE